MSPKDFGTAIRVYRCRYNLSQADVGKKVGLSDTTVGRIERGDRTVSGWVRERLQAGLSLGATELATLLATKPKDPCPFPESRNDAAVGFDDAKWTALGELLRKIGDRRVDARSISMIGAVLDVLTADNATELFRCVPHPEPVSETQAEDEP